MQNYFYELADHLTGTCKAGETMLLNYWGEESDFIRFNRSLVRQAGNVAQRYLSIELIAGGKHTRESFTISMDRHVDRERAAAVIDGLRGQLALLAADPYLLYSTTPASSEHVAASKLGPAEAAIDAILAAGAGLDMVGIFAQGGTFRGFANSLGQRNWFLTHSFNMEWSFYAHDDKAVKTSYAGFEWHGEQFARKVAVAREQLEALQRPAKTVPPGEYRLYLAPSALDSFVGMVVGDGFSIKAHRTKSTVLLQMAEAGATLSPAVSMTENTREGLSPNFTLAGYAKPPQVPLLKGGRLAEMLISPRSAKEFGMTPNSGGEGPSSLDMAGGDMLAADAAAKLGTGVYANQLWYLNYSDKPAGRITGMTRFATFWVENGRIAAPLNVMRFDETAYRVLGENLLALTTEREFIPDATTYENRSTDSVRLPGALIKDFRFTL